MPTVQINDSTVPGERVIRGIGQTWRLLIGRPPEPGVSFAEAGGDSLGVLEIIFNLERLLAVKLPMDRFHSGLTAEEFAQEALASISVDDNIKRQLQTPIFFCPPALGDTGFMADFRRSGGNDLCFVAVDYPDLRRCAVPGFGWQSLIDTVLEQIRAHVPLGPVRLAGYSWGGRIAYEAAVLLETEGREVSFLGILDTPAPGLMPRGNGGALDRPRAWCRAIYLLAVLPRGERNRRLARHLARCLVIEWAAPLTRLLARRSARRGGRSSVGSLSNWTMFYLRAWLLRAACERALDHDRRTPPKLSAPLVLFRCAGGLADTEPDLGWGRIAENVTIVPVPGDHVSIVGQEHVKSTAAAFVDAFTMIEADRSRRGQAVCRDRCADALTLPQRSASTCPLSGEPNA
jgi:thioesterase domain-containing protein